MRQSCFHLAQVPLWQLNATWQAGRQPGACGGTRRFPVPAQVSMALYSHQSSVCRGPNAVLQLLDLSTRLTARAEASSSTRQGPGWAALPLPCGLPCSQLIQQLPLSPVPARFLPASQAGELPWIPAKRRSPTAGAPRCLLCPCSPTAPPVSAAAQLRACSASRKMYLARISPSTCLLANQRELGLLVSLLNKNAWQNSQGTFHLILFRALLCGYSK